MGISLVLGSGSIHPFWARYWRCLKNLGPLLLWPFRRLKMGESWKRSWNPLRLNAIWAGNRAVLSIKFHTKLGVCMLRTKWSDAGDMSGDRESVQILWTAILVQNFSCHLPSEKWGSIQECMKIFRYLFQPCRDLTSPKIWVRVKCKIATINTHEHYFQAIKESLERFTMRRREISI